MGPSWFRRRGTTAVLQRVAAYRSGPAGQTTSANEMDRSASDLTFPEDWASSPVSADRSADLVAA